ncbi:MAG: HEPN domain-containing protein [Chloroflexota bacterium]|nr:HEPN domain-containing protein [Chloroflexota bacterium]
MNRSDLQRLAELRLQDAGILLANGRSEAAYYLAGYTVECALKACIAKQVRQYNFPDKRLAIRSFTHDLTDLVDIAGLKAVLTNAVSLSAALAANWNVVKEWNETSRYSLAITQADAQALYTAISDPSTGVLTWLKHHW